MAPDIPIEAFFFLQSSPLVLIYSTATHSSNGNLQRELGACLKIEPKNFLSQTVKS